MVLSGLGKGLTSALQKFVSNQTIDEKTFDDLLKDICRALLESDVNVKLVQNLRQNVKKSVDWANLPNGINKKRLVQKVVFEELCKMVEAKTAPYVPEKGKSNVIMFVGLQGSGKTTSCTKLAHYYARKGWKVGLVCGDTFRAGAFDQLKQNAAKAKIPFYGAYDEADPVKIVSEGCQKFKSDKFEIIIVDTSGRHKQEGDLFKEMQLISEAAQPDSIIFVMDGSIGQAAEGQALAFKEAVQVGSIILTKMDGSGKGGGALSAIAATGAPIAFLGTGEHMYDFEPFQSQSFISKLLGMGDVSGLMDRFNDAAMMTNKEKTMEMAKRMEQGVFTLGDLKEQLQMMVNMGPMSKVLGMIPGMSGMLASANGGDEDVSTKMKSFLTCLDSLSRSELVSDGKTLTDPSRMNRIKKGSGCKEEIIIELLQHYRKFAQVIKKMGGSGGFMKNMMGAMGGGASGRGGSPGLNPQMMQQMQSAMGGSGGFDLSEMMTAMGGMSGMGGLGSPSNPSSDSIKRRSRRDFTPVESQMMACGRNILECSISELAARQKLKNVSDSEDSNNIEVIEEIEQTIRRPYLSRTERIIAETLPESALKEYFKPGEFVHIPMIKEEKVLIENFIKFKKRKLELENLDEEDINLIAEMLPGRKFEDLQSYLKDLSSKTVDVENEPILVFNSSSLESELTFPAYFKTSCLRLHRPSDWCKSIQKQFSIFESSGSIVQIACRSGFRSARVMVGACATTDDERYNRIGELILAYREPKKSNTNNYDVAILDGHKKVKNTPNGSVNIRHTVSCVVYEPLSDIFISGGYDGDVVAWNASDALSIDTIGSHPKPINSISCHSSTPLIAYGCQNGGLYYFNSMSQLGERGNKARPVNIFTKPKVKDVFSNTVDCVAIPSTGSKANSCYAGIGYLYSSASGVVEEWDLQSGLMTSSSEKLNDGFACMSISACGKMLAAGTGGISSEQAKGDGILRIMDLDQDLKTSMTINTRKYDMDSVSFCPRSNLLFLGETSDSSVSVYDLRFPSEPLFSTSHGTTRVDSVVAHAWISKGSILATGGHDGQVKLWDCQRGFSLLNKFEFNSSISCITYSEADHSIWVGADNGGVYMLSGPGFLDDNHPAVLSGSK